VSAKLSRTIGILLTTGTMGEANSDVSRPSWFVEEETTAEYPGQSCFFADPGCMNTA
jgi:hypothetical protein